MDPRRPDLAQIRHGASSALPAVWVSITMLVAACTSGATQARPTASPDRTTVASAPASSSATPSASPSLSPSVSPSPSPTRTIRAASMVAHVPYCQDALGWDYVVSGNDFFVVCTGTNQEPGPNSYAAGPYVARVDLRTNKVTATYRYKTPITYIEGIEVAGGNLWFDGIFGGSACAVEKPGDCEGWQRVERFDLATGKNTLEIRNVSLMGGGFGYVWIQENSFGDPRLKGYLRKLDPATGKEMGRIPFSMDIPLFACGSLWGMTRSNYATADTTTTLARIDPANGSILARFTEPGELFGLQAVGSECWATAAPGGSDFDLADYADHFVRIGDSGIEYRSPHFDAGIVRDLVPEPPSESEVQETYVALAAGAFWLVRDDLGPIVTIQEIDPVTWRPWPTAWQWSGTRTQGQPFVIVGGAVWACDSQGGIGRLDIPI